MGCKIMKIFDSSTFTAKNLSKRTRPSDKHKYSLSSGHTGNAFAAAEFLTQEMAIFHLGMALQEIQ